MKKYNHFFFTTAVKMLPPCELIRHRLAAFTAFTRGQCWSERCALHMWLVVSCSLTTDLLHMG